MIKSWKEPVTKFFGMDRFRWCSAARARAPIKCMGKQTPIKRILVRAFFANTCGTCYIEFTAVWSLLMVPCSSSPVARLYLAKNEGPEEEAGISIRWFSQSMFTLYRMALAPIRKHAFRIGLLLTHENDDFSAISVTVRSCATLISKVGREWGATYR